MSVSKSTINEDDPCSPVNGGEDALVLPSNGSADWLGRQFCLVLSGAAELLHGFKIVSLRKDHIFPQRFLTTCNIGTLKMIFEVDARGGFAGWRENYVSIC